MNSFTVLIIMNILFLVKSETTIIKTTIPSGTITPRTTSISFKSTITSIPTTSNPPESTTPPESTNPSDSSSNNEDVYVATQNNDDYYDNFWAEDIFLGFGNYSYISNVIRFFAYIRRNHENKENFPLKLKLTQNLRLLEEKTLEDSADCEYQEDHENVYKYICTLKNVNGSISKVEISEYEIDTTPLAEKMGANLQNYKDDILSKDGIILIDKCRIVNQNLQGKIKIKGTNYSSFDSNNIKLYVVSNDGNVIDVPGVITYSDGEAEMLLTPKRSIKANLDDTIGKIEKGKNIYLKFPDTKGNSTADDLDFKGATNFGYRKNSGGLSTGGIIAIIIPCILVLLAVGAVAFFLGRKTPDPQVQAKTLENNNAGYNSSTNIVN